MILQLCAGTSEHYTNGPSQIWDELRQQTTLFKPQSWRCFLYNTFCEPKKTTCVCVNCQGYKNDRKTPRFVLFFPRYAARRAKAVHPAALRISLAQWVHRIQGIPATAAKISMSERWINMLFRIVKVQDCHTTFSEWKVIERTAQPVLHTLHGNLRTQCQNVFAVYTC